MRRIVLGGLIGGLPGLLLALVPLILQEMDVITSDQSQIGFIGIPVMFVGVLIGIAFGAQRTPHAGQAMLGMVAGLVAGVVVGVGIGASGVNVPGLPIFLPAVTMIAGAALGAWWGEHSGEPRRFVPHH